MAKHDTGSPGAPTAENENDYSLAAEKLKAVKEVGRGAMGRVFLAVDGAGAAVAVKAMSKPALEKATDGKKRAQTELDILSALAGQPHPFLPRLLRRIDTDGLLAWVVDYCPGGDLYALRRRQPRKAFSESTIRFYAAEIVLALEHLHALGIAYRDLKPENVLIRVDGHVMLTDFDLSTWLAPVLDTDDAGSDVCAAPCQTGCLRWPRRRRRLKSPSAKVTPASGSGKRRFVRSNSFVGTEEYVAPEMVAGKGHDAGIDWWALGILLFEMLYGRTPFRGETRKDTFYRILVAEAEFEGPWSFLRDLIVRLLQKDPRFRLGCGDAGASEVKSHAFFRGVDWDALREMRVRAPFVPGAVSVDEVVKGCTPLDLEQHLSVVPPEKETLA